MSVAVLAFRVVVAVRAQTLLRRILATDQEAHALISCLQGLCWLSLICGSSYVPELAGSAPANSHSLRDLEAVDLLS